ncbi:MAG: AI-2E family transporter [Candidatus Pacebacteria bacterium]|nr:AI-2E family transporter [Candidatus Paceibacterota bacterium]
MKQNVLESIFFLGLLAVSGGVLFMIFKPYIAAMFIAAIFASIFYPLYMFLLRYFKGKKDISAFLTVMVVLVVILLPLLIMGTVLFQETKDIAVGLQKGDGTINFVETKLEAVELYLNDLAPDANINIDLRSVVQTTALWVTDHLGTLFSGVAKGTLNLFLMIIALFFFLRDGKKIHGTLVRWSPLRDKCDENIMNKVVAAVDSVVKGSLLIAALQGFLLGVGFAIFGVSSPVLWGFVGIFASLIPSVGTALVWVPGVLYLFFAQDATVMAIGLAVWGVLIVGLADNFLRPILIERGVKTHPLLIFLSIFGGISLFGPIGLLVGPIVLSFVFALVDVYPDVIQNGNEHTK